MPKTTKKMASAESVIEVTEATIEKSQSYIGQWNQLISTTNWDKGVIIAKWKESLKESDAPASEYSDEAWSQLVGGVTPQHVGRLRRTHERFGHVFKEYEGLFWSHFYAALDWDDAEMWLEGAVQSKWSISGMRHQRWETLGKDPNEKPVDGDIVAMELAEESQSLALAEQSRRGDADFIEGPVHEGPDFGDEEPSSKSKKSSDKDDDDEDEKEVAAPHMIRPFESFKDLPEDVTEACNAFKVAIIRHKAEEWEAIKQQDMIDLLDALKQLASISAN